MTINGDLWKSSFKSTHNWNAFWGNGYFIRVQTVVDYVQSYEKESMSLTLFEPWSSKPNIGAFVKCASHDQPPHAQTLIWIYTVRLRVTEVCLEASDKKCSFRSESTDWPTDLYLHL